ncbi:MAG: hypothetical protein PHD82_14710 [Candidatus Riflebacteria bacterium]|nr:hypothetical protein [Candidatus Riflebacteria bacterium]
MKFRTLIVLALCSCTSGLWAEPCALVNDPRDLRLINLQEISSFLEEDLDLGKGITEVIGKKVIDRRFRAAGIPDPAKSELSYSIVAREMPADQLNICFVLKGNLNAEKFLEFADKRYQRYFSNLKAQKLVQNAPTPGNIMISGKQARVYPFAFRNAEAIVTTFPGHAIISTVPAGDYSLINETVAVLEGKTPMSDAQPKKIGFISTFIPVDQERAEIRTFENRYEGFAAKTRKQFKKIMAKEAYRNSEEMARSEQQLKEALAETLRFSYDINARQQNDGYAYEVSMIFRCATPEKAAQLKEMLLTWLAYSASKALSAEDMVSMKANRVAASGNSCIFNIRLGSSTEEQYQFSSLLLSLMMQDRRFNSIFQG